MASIPKSFSRPPPIQLLTSGPTRPLRMISTPSGAALPLRPRKDASPNKLPILPRSIETAAPNNPIPPSFFNKTGLKPPLFARDNTINAMRDEYSKSGGDDAVAENEIASFKDYQDTAPEIEKEICGKGNVINPLEVSPASREYSAVVEEKVLGKDGEVVGERVVGLEKQGGTRSRLGHGVKAKKVEVTQIDLEKMRMRGR